MKLIIAGSRCVEESDEIVADALVFAGLSDVSISEVVSGGANGADRAGEKWARFASIKVVKFPANWDKYGKSAGYKRNVQMAEYTDAGLIIWDGKSRGSKHMIDILTKMKKPYYIVMLSSLLERS
jgi:hypothetical protein